MGGKNGKEENKATKPAKSKSPEATNQQDPSPPTTTSTEGGSQDDPKPDTKETRDPKPVKGVAHDKVIVHVGSDQRPSCVYSQSAFYKISEVLTQLKP